MRPTRASTYIPVRLTSEGRAACIDNDCPVLSALEDCSTSRSSLECWHAALSRTLHTAQDAIDTKYVIQQWIVRGWQTKVKKPVAAAGSAVPERVVMSIPAKAETTPKDSTGKSKKKKKGSKGFKK
jgi:hypothetical protein